MNYKSYYTGGHLLVELLKKDDTIKLRSGS